MLYYYNTSEYSFNGLSFFYIGAAQENVSPVPVKYLYSSDHYLKYDPFIENWIYLKNRTTGQTGQNYPVVDFEVNSCLVVSTYDLKYGIFKPIEIKREDIPYFSDKGWMYRGYSFYVFNLHPKTLVKYLESYVHEVERI